MFAFASAYNHRAAAFTAEASSCCACRDMIADTDVVSIFVAICAVLPMIDIRLCALLIPAIILITKHKSKV